MEHKFKFEKLNIWQKSMDFAEEMNNLTKVFPDNEKFNLSSQLLRVSDSISLNISEGAIGQSVAEYKKFLGYSIRSLAEVVTCLHKANRRKYFSEKDFDKYYGESFHLMNMMLAFKKSLK